MMILIITTTMRITEVNPEAIDLIEAKILDNFSEVKIRMVAVNAVKICTKANIKVTITKVITTKATLVYMSCHHSLGATGVTLNTRNASS